MRMTVNSLFDEYMSSKQHDVRKTSLDKSKRVLSCHVLPHFGRLTLNKLTRPALQDWKNAIASKNLAVTTCNGIYKEFNAMLNYAVKIGHMPKNPLSTLGSFKEPIFTKPEEKIQYYTADEFIRYLSAADELCRTPKDRGYFVFFAIAYYTGMRKGEINALKWSDIDDNVIHVRRSIAQKIKGSDIETPPKNKSSYRDLQMPKPLIDILNRFKPIQQLTPQWCEDFRVCGGINCLRDTSISNKNIQFAKAANLHVIRIHDFRHSHASLLANEGINIQEVARRLGHSNEEERALIILDKIIPNLKQL